MISLMFLPTMKGHDSVILINEKNLMPLLTTNSIHFFKAKLAILSVLEAVQHIASNVIDGSWEGNV